MSEFSHFELVQINRTLEKRIAELEAQLKTSRESAKKYNHAWKEAEAQLEKIANYPDPDFPAEDATEEAKRAWRIVYTLKSMALGGEDE